MFELYYLFENNILFNNCLNEIPDIFFQLNILLILLL